MRSGSFLVVVSVILAFLVAYPVYAADKGDLTGDGYADMDDLSVIAGDWLTDGTLADLAPIAGNPNVSISDGDGIVDNKDLALMAENWRNESQTVSSNALDYCLQTILATEADLFSTWGLENTPESTENSYSNWRIYWRSDPDYAEGWTNGFFPGCLWYMYELTGDPATKTKAMLWTERIEGMKNYTQMRALFSCAVTETVIVSAERRVQATTMWFIQQQVHWTQQVIARLSAAWNPGTGAPTPPLSRR